MCSAFEDDKAIEHKSLREWIPDVYRRACEHAHRLLFQWHGVDRPDTASLVDRAVYELLRWGETPCASREHALGLLVQKMRFVSVDLARGLGALKRGGPGRGRQSEARGATAEPLVGLPGPSTDHLRYLALDEALDRLGAVAPRLKQVIAYRFLLGLSVDETAAELGLAPASIRKDTQLAKAWLFSELAADGRPPGAPDPDRDEP